MKIRFKDVKLDQHFYVGKKEYKRIPKEKTSDCNCSVVNAVDISNDKKVFFAKMLKVRIEDETN